MRCKIDIWESLTSHINGCGLRECLREKIRRDIGVKCYLVENNFLGVPDLERPGKTRRKTSYLETIIIIIIVIIIIRR